MSFNDDFTLIDLEQIQPSREYQDQHAAGPQNEGSGVCDFNDDHNRTISAIRRLIHGVGSGNGNWYDAPSIGLSGLHQDIINLQLASGAEPHTWTEVFDTGSGILDTVAFDADIRLPDGRIWRFQDGAGANPIMEVSNSGVQIRNLGFREILEFTTAFAPGATITIPNDRQYTLGDDASNQFPNLRVFFNGQLMSPGSGVSSGDENRRDYREATATTIVTNRRLRANANRPSRLEFHING